MHSSEDGLSTKQPHARLASDEIHVWYLLADSFSLEGRAPDWLMDSGERQRHARLRTEQAGREYLLTRVLLRTTLSRYAALEPAAWRFVEGRFGRPELAPGQVEAPLYFNVSNAAGLIACVLGSQPELGIDVEGIDPAGATPSLEVRCCSPAEVTALSALPGSARAARFFELWTLKEAYLKARGVGLGLPLQQISFELTEDDVRVSFGPAIADTPHGWQFDRLLPSSAHRVATAVRGGSATRIRVVERVYGSS